VTLQTGRWDDWRVDEAVTELKELADTAGADAVATLLQRRSRPDGAFFVGRGKAAELDEALKEHDAELLLFNHDLTPVQHRNLEDITAGRVIDRSQLILDIFAQRARSHEGKLQVELAQLMYLLPRLAGRGSRLSRLGGGIGTRGPGETKLEVDRRRIRHRVTVLRRELDEVRRHRAVQREGRRAAGLPLVALVGYTNAGKSSLLNALGGAAVQVEDRLFATLDPTVRRVEPEEGPPFLLADTVGFIRDLPSDLAVAFRATLEELTDADLLVHVLDAAHPYVAEHDAAVNGILEQLGLTDKALLKVYNKVDLLPAAPESERGADRPLFVSATTGEGLPRLLQAIGGELTRRHCRCTFVIPYSRQQLVSLLHARGRILEEDYRQDGVVLTVEADDVTAAQVRSALEQDSA